MHRGFALLFSTMLCAASACGGPRPATSGGDRRALIAAPATAEDPVVAQVGERPIRASEVALEARAAGVTPRAALDSLIAAEVLAVAAIDHGLLEDRDVIDAGKAARVRRLLATVFEIDTPAAKIPDSDYEKSYQKNKQAFEHEEAVEVWHLVAQIPLEGATVAQRARAHAKIEGLLKAATDAPRDEAFAALATPPRGPDDPNVKAEHITFSRDDVEKPFADAAFALRSLAPGATSGVVDTRYGSHVIRFVRHIPARHTALADARAELEVGTLEIWRRRELQAFVRGLIEQTHVEVFSDRLTRAELADEAAAP